MSFCFLKEKSLCLGTSYKAKDVFIGSGYYCYITVKSQHEMQNDTVCT